MNWTRDDEHACDATSEKTSYTINVLYDRDSMLTRTLNLQVDADRL